MTGPEPEKESASRLKRLKEKLKNLTTKKKLKYKGHGRLNVIWRQEDLPSIVKAIVKKHKGITSIYIEKNQITWNYEWNMYDLFPPKKKGENPSKRN